MFIGFAGVTVFVYSYTGILLSFGGRYAKLVCYKSQF